LISDPEYSICYNYAIKGILQNMKYVFCLTSIFLLVISTPLVHAASPNLIVRISDDTGMPLSNVSITLENRTTDSRGEKHKYITYSEKTGKEGLIWFKQIPAGSYIITASRSGFMNHESDSFLLETDMLSRIEIKLKPLLEGIIVKPYKEMLIRNWPFPSLSSEAMDCCSTFSDRTVPEIMEQIPGVLVNPETGHPRFPSQRTSDLGLYIDNIPVFDPADHRPAFFPPAWFINKIKTERAGIDTDQASSLGGNIILETPGPGAEKLTGAFGISEIIFNDSFINTTEAKDAFNYWSSHNGEIEQPIDSSPNLTDTRYQLLLKSNLSFAQLIMAADLRQSNHGYVSDIVSNDSLVENNIWLKIMNNWSESVSVSFTGGYQKSSLSPDAQWKLRGLPPLSEDKRNLFGAFEFRKRFLSNYLFSVILSGLYLDSQSAPDKEQSSFEYPYGLGNWSADNQRGSYNLIFKTGRTTQIHATETGFRFNQMDIDIVEGFYGAKTINSPEGYIWESKDSAYEFSLWGRDRWFLSRNLELGIGIRWDRLNYLEESDYLSPRFYAVYQKSNHHFEAGVERIVQSPGIGFISDQIVIPIDSDYLEPVTEPQLGFRWFGEYEFKVNKLLSIEARGFYTLMSKTVVMLPLETEPGIEFIMPVSGASGKISGCFFDLHWAPVDFFHFKVGYGFNRSRLPWGEDVRLSFLSPYPEMPWERVYYNTDVSHTMPLENDLTHALRVFMQTTFSSIKTNLKLEYRLTSGLKYTIYKIGPDGKPSYSPEEINRESGSDVHRVDIELNRVFKIFENLNMDCHLSLQNAFNQFQFPLSDPYKRKSIIDPYRTDYNQPRTLVGTVVFSF